MRSYLNCLGCVAKEPLNFSQRCPAGGPNLNAPVPDQDAHNFVRVQKGLEAGGISELILGEQELLVRHFHAVLDRHLQD